MAGLVQNNSGSTSGFGFLQTVTAAFSSPVTAGNSIIVAVGSAFGRPATITDTLGSSYTLVKAVGVGSGNGGAAVYRADSIGGGANTVTVDVGSGNTDAFTVNVYECTPLGTIDINISAVASTFNTANAGTATPAQASEFCVTALGDGGSSGAFSAGSGWTISDAFAYSFGSAEHQVISSTATLTGNTTAPNSSQWAAVMCTFPFAATSAFGTPDFNISSQANPGVTSSFPVSVGDVIAVLTWGFSFTGTITVTDSAGNSYTDIGSQFTTPGGTPMNLFYTIVTNASGSNIVSIAGSGGSVRQAGVLHVPCSGTATFDTSASTTNTGTTITTPSSNTAGTDEFVFLGIVNDGGAVPTAPGGYTGHAQFDAASSASVFWNKLAAPQSGYQPAVGFNASSGAGLVFAAFKATGGGGGGNNISGNTGIAGATVAYAGTASGTVTADGSGNYSILGLATGSYTITPSLAGYVFTPTNRSETISGSDIFNVNFTASLAPSSVTLPAGTARGVYSDGVANVYAVI